MPRLCTSLLLHAHAISPLLPLLLRACRDLPSARNELRWLRQHAATKTSKSASNPQTSLHHMCAERARGRPLQYILGTQPFGALEILCKPGVLIPRYPHPVSVDPPSLPPHQKQKQIHPTNPLPPAAPKPKPTPSTWPTSSSPTPPSASSTSAPAQPASPSSSPPSYPATPPTSTPKSTASTPPPPPSPSPAKTAATTTSPPPT